MVVYHDGSRSRVVHCGLFYSSSTAVCVTHTELGSVVSLWRYPVKSMMGEELNSSEVTDRGLLGDRTFALVDSVDGKVVSAKNPRKWPNMFDFRAQLALPNVNISLPDGRVVNSSDKGIGTFFDVSTVHVLTTATLDCFRELYPEGRFETRRFRPNVVVQTASDEKRFAEKDWIGQTVAFGPEVRLNIMRECKRCVMTTLAQGDLPKDPGILRTVARHNDVKLGVYASVVRGGTIRRGDRVSIE